MSKKRIGIRLGTKRRWFKDPHSFLEWAQEQKMLLEFVPSTGNQYGQQNFRNEHIRWWDNHTNAIQSTLQHLYQNGTDENYQDAVSEVVNTIEEAVDGKQTIVDSLDFWGYVSEYIEDGNSLYATVACAVYLNKNLNNIDMTVAQGLIRFHSWQSGEDNKIEHIQSGLEDMKSNWDMEINSQIDSAISANEKAETLCSRHEKLLKGQQERFHKQIKDLTDNTSEILKGQDEEFQRISNLYNTDLALNAPVVYWKKQAKYHKDRTIFYGVVSALLVVIFMLSFMGYSVVQLNTIWMDTPVSKIVAALVFTSIGIWVIRITIGLFLAHNHLYTDANERRTMIHTYLSLARSKHGLKEEEKQLILQTLFRPNTTGMIKEDNGPANLVDLVNRAKPK